MLPPEVLAKLQSARSSDPLLLRRYADSFSDASVLFIEISPGENYAPSPGEGAAGDRDAAVAPAPVQLSPSALLDLLNTVFLHLDELVEDAGLLKVETIGAQYVAAAGEAFFLSPSNPKAVPGWFSLSLSSAASPASLPPHPSP